MDRIDKRRYIRLNAQRLSRKGVGPSGPKWKVLLKSKDIVLSIWKHIAVHKRTRIK